MIMSFHQEHALKRMRRQRGWSQAELAERSSVSRTAISGIESGRMTPSVNAALSIARAFEVSVESLFGNEDAGSADLAWALPVSGDSARYWLANVGGRTLRYPIESTFSNGLPHDGLLRDGQYLQREMLDPGGTLVLASCDPAAGLLAGEYMRRSRFRMIVLPRSSSKSLSLLGKGLIHVAGLHLASADRPNENAEVVEDRLGKGYRLVHVANWQEGLAIAPSANIRSVRSAMRSPISWIGREVGSGARQCLDELFEGRRPPRRSARDHRGVADAIRCGWADAGVCLRLVSEEAQLQFLPIRWDCYDLCFPESLQSDPRIAMLLDLIRDMNFRRLLSELPGFDTRRSGEMLGS